MASKSIFCDICDRSTVHYNMSPLQLVEETSSNFAERAYAALVSIAPVWKLASLVSKFFELGPKKCTLCGGVIFKDSTSHQLFVDDEWRYKNEIKNDP
jgi:hypothetical protein